MRKAATQLEFVDEYDNKLMDLPRIPVEKLSKDIMEAMKSLTPTEARYLVDSYYQLQGYRIALASQTRQAEKKEPTELLGWLTLQLSTLEDQVKGALQRWGTSVPIAVWAQSICGIGPVIAAGLAAHIDITKVDSAASIWRFAGLDPTLKWEKGEKRPFNAELRALLAFKLGESFVKMQNRGNDFYGKIYRARKDLETQRNENGAFAEQAKHALATKRINKSTDAYKAYIIGKLPPAHVHARARRYAVKLFIAHYFMTAYFIEYGKLPVKPYALSILEHKDFIPPPNAHLIPGYAEALKQWQ